MLVRKKTIFISALILVFLALFFLLIESKKEIYRFEGDKFLYSQERNAPKYKMTFKASNNSIDIYAINFQSRPFLSEETRIYGFLFLPQNKTALPAVVLLPGGGGTKERESRLAMLIAQQGYAVLTIDQRGIGETGGTYLSFEQDFLIAKEGKEPVQHLSVYDALRTFDVLRAIKKIDKNKVALAGESMGGRYAIIAVALDSRIKGVIGIGTGGFHMQKDTSIPYNYYLLSIDPDHYISDISPRPLVMLHGANDSVVKLEDAQRTFQQAQEPKKFLVVECNHGYCGAMEPALREALAFIFDRQ